ncbi:hypothetical protein [Paracoccus pantotrophus]|uniref:hypothetical protein n=1 Tax=Paracoccus pantotrophus TaxID=82367 RepID=UPI0004917198|nr:hypothetical protein [Paracoccus pantotrophus]
MQTLALFIAPLVFMALAFASLLYAGFAAGSTSDRQQLGYGLSMVCIILMLIQAMLWVLWGLRLGRDIG